MLCLPTIGKECLDPNGIRATGFRLFAREYVWKANELVEHKRVRCCIVE